MKKFKIILVSLLSVVDLYFLYSTIGYLILGIQTPKILGDRQTTFMGMYMMSITFGVLFVLLTITIIILCIKFFKSKQDKKE